uniref:LAGLIDADG homing endonuclease n=1 Tax=Panagrolaimus sp. ES5 TaxID=591445 RepID=A0AC34GRB3_9BILA
MSTTSNIQINPKWGFKVEKDSKGILQIIFNTWRGKRKATPHFLIAIFINFLFKSTKECIRFRPRVVDIQIGDNFKWVENGIIEALKILDHKYDIKSDRGERLIKADMLYYKVNIRLEKESEESLKKLFQSKGRKFR